MTQKITVKQLQERGQLRPCVGGVEYSSIKRSEWAKKPNVFQQVLDFFKFGAKQ